MTTRGINASELDQATRDGLGINLAPSVEQAGVRHIALGKVLKAIKALEEEDVLWVLHQAKTQYNQQGELQQGNSSKYIPPISWIIQVVARHFSLNPATLKQRSRTQVVALARQVVMYICWSYEKYTLNQIGLALGDRSPATISHGFSNIADLMTKDEGLRDLIERIQKEMME